MNKVIEVDFLPRETDVAFSWLDSIGDSARRILIVDNDKNSTHLVKVLLEKTGRYLVFEENEPTRAHLSARNFRPDLILLDVVMPDTDGGEVAARIKMEPELQNTPIIFLTALVTRDRSERWPPNRRASISRQANQHFRVDRSDCTKCTDSRTILIMSTSQTSSY